MKKQFQHIKNFVQDIKDSNLNTRDSKSETLSADLKNAEKKLDLIKQVCQNTEKKITACLQLLPSGHLNNNSFAERNLNNINPMNSSFVANSLSSNTEDQLMDTLLLEKKQKKVPEVQLHQALQEMGDLFDNDSILGITLSESSEIQKQLSKELLRYEQDVERLCLSPLNDIMENDIPAVLKSRKLLNKTSSEVDNLKLKLNQAIKHNQQNASNTNQQKDKIKIDLLSKELQDASLRLVQVKNNFVMDLYNFLNREAEFACIYLQLFKLRANYHKNVVDIIEQNMPRLEKIILSTNQKAVFGTSLIEYAEQTNRDLSIVVEYCVFILNGHLNEEGLFRIPGSASKVKKLKSFFNMQTYQMIQEYNNNQLNGESGFYLSNLENYDEYSNDPHSVAGCLKQFFRELPEPLFAFAVYEDLVQCAGIQQTNDRLTALWKIVNSLPKPHIENLRYLIKFFAKLAANSEMNKMSAQNIAIAISPSLIWAPPSSETGNSSPSSTANQMTYGLDMCSANQYGIIIETLILYSDWFFPEPVDFDSMRKVSQQRERKQSEESRDVASSSQSQQNSPKSSIKSQTSNYLSNKMSRDRNYDRNPLPTPRMSTRAKKPPAPQVPISQVLNQSNENQNGNLNLSNQNISCAANETSSNFVTNSPFLSNQNSATFQNEPRALKSFERKGSFQSDRLLATPLSKKQTNHSNSSSGTGSTSNSQDSVCGDQSSQQINIQPEKQLISFNNNRSDDSLLSSATEPNYQNLEQYQSSSSSSENLDTPHVSSTPLADLKRAHTSHNQTPATTKQSDYNSNNNNLIGGSLDRRTVRQLNVNERSRQIGAKTSSSFMNPQNRSTSRGSSGRPLSIPPPPPKPQFKSARSHDDLLVDEPLGEQTSSETASRSSEDTNEPDRRFNLKLDVKGKSYEDELPDCGNSPHLISYVKLDGNDVKFSNHQVNNENNLVDTDQINKVPEKPPRSNNSPPPRPIAPSIFKSSKSLMNEHTYL